MFQNKKGLSFTYFYYNNGIPLHSANSGDTCRNLVLLGKLFRLMRQSQQVKLNLSFSTNVNIIAGSLESAYSLNWGAREIWGKGGGETLALL